SHLSAAMALTTSHVILALVGVGILVIPYHPTHAVIDIKAWMPEGGITPELVVTELIEYYKQEDPQGIPVLSVPEPIEINDKISASGIELWDLEISGHSGGKLDYLMVNLTSLKAMVRITVPFINIIGDYSWPGYFCTSEGTTNITLKGIEVTVEAELDISSVGVLQVGKIEIDMEYADNGLHLDFVGLCGMHSTMVGAADIFFGSVIQPIITGQLASRIKDRANGILEKRLAEKTFPNSISPIDYMVAKLRGDFRAKLDPLKAGVKEIDLASGVTVKLSDMQVTGLSTIHRTQEISMKMVDNRLYFTVQIGTNQIVASADWSLSAALLPAIGGHFDAEVESLDITVEAQQDANIAHPPILRKLDINLGNIAVRSKGEGTMDYVLEAVVNILPNALRNIIMDVLEKNRIPVRVQERLSQLDVERLVKQKLQEMATRKAAAAQ
ncbi:unnamed protein product, partial [Meganyctiphanes norvegica]